MALARVATDRRGRCRGAEAARRFPFIGRRRSAPGPAPAIWRSRTGYDSRTGPWEDVSIRRRAVRVLRRDPHEVAHDGNRGGARPRRTRVQARRLPRLPESPGANPRFESPHAWHG